MNGKTKTGIAVVVLVLLVAVVTAYAGNLKPRKPGPQDKCAVCGMFVAKYPNFASQIQFKDAAVAFFDGPRDLFTYYHNLSRYNPRKKLSDIGAVFVTDYYTLTPIDGLTAWYVIGSDVYGPMGSELVSFGKEADAREFNKDHKGKAVLRFRQITPAVLKGLE